MVSVQEYATKENASLNADDGRQTADEAYGSIVIIENVFHYKQVLPLQMPDPQDG